MRWHWLVIALASVPSMAQGVELGMCSEDSPAPNRQMLKAEAALDQGDLAMSKVYVQSLVRKYPDSPHTKFLVAELQARLKNPAMALKLLEDLAEICPDYVPDLDYRIGALYMGMGKQDRAVRAWRRFLEHSQRVSSVADQREDVLGWFAVRDFRDSLMSHPVAFNPRPIEGLSTPADEYLGVLSPDESQWFFTKTMEEIDLDGRVGARKTVDEYFCSANVTDGRVQSVMKLEYPFNQGNNEGGPGITADNQWLVLTYCTTPNDCGLFLVQNEYDAWGRMKPIMSVNVPGQWDSQPCISANGDKIIFASNRPGGMGGLDLWMVQRLATGGWSDPINLGPEVNTPNHEKSPFLHADGRTLYFSSKGHMGMGNYDVFRTDLMTKGAPINLGYPINTSAAEVGFAVTASGARGYFSSETSGNFDFYEFELPPSVLPGDIQFIRGRVQEFDITSSQMQVRIDALGTGATSHVTVNESGEFLAVIEAQADEIVISLDHPEIGYTSQRIELMPDEDPDVVPLLVAKEAKVGEVFDVRSVHFATNSYEVSARDRLALKPFAEYLKRNPEYRIELQGHTDNVGASRDNLILSQHRAEAVRGILISWGIDASRLVAKGYGDRKPIASNGSSYGRSQNRRTAFQILAQ